ncbi:erlin-1 [Pyrus ussuriensis x Pyrus communis]|uniref:Erlin-1 n=1 Tax=Pyrus ussuriensis x Pyrus communis TaxID=2448454 RepID=A0A5N5FKP3_9ROSA|nr:erlin-1 [Pyrus ussuriensis x Pyrus communis]
MVYLTLALKRLILRGHEQTAMKKHQDNGNLVSQLALCMTVLPTSSTISIMHQVLEGHFGVYWRGGALLKTVTDPVFISSCLWSPHFEYVQLTPQIDEVRDIPCGTKGVVMINFEKIEVRLCDIIL